MEKINKNMLMSISFELSFNDLMNTCSTNKRIWKLCQDDELWKYRAINILGYEQEDLPVLEKGQWKEWYMKNNGYVYGWGNNFYKQLSSENVNNIKDIAFLHNGIKSIECSGDRTALIDTDDNLFINEKFIMSNVDQVVIGYTLVSILSQGSVYSMNSLGEIHKIQSKYKIQYVSNRFDNGIALINGNIYRVLLKEPYTLRKMNLGVKNVKYVKAVGLFFIFITEDNRLYFVVNNKKHLVSKNVKFATCILDKDVIYQLYWTDSNNVLYTTSINSRSTRINDYIDEILTKNESKIMNNVIKVNGNHTSLLILTTDHILHKSDGKFSDLESYYTIDDNVKDMCCGDKHYLVLRLE